MARNNETTTKFKVDISDLKSAMQEARKQVAYANSEFKAVSSSLDDWSKSSEGLTAKLKQLKSNLDSQEAVLNEYEKTLEEVKKQYGENSKEALEYATKLNNQQAVVNKIKKEMAGYEDALKEVSEAEKIASKTGKDVAEVLDDLRKEAEDAEGGFTILKGAVAEFVGNALTQLVSGLRDGIASLITFGDEADKAMNSFQASTGATAEEMGKFEDAMNNIYKANYGESFEDIATAMAEVKRQSGDIGADELEKMTTNALILRDTFDFEVSESMRATKMLMTQFGLSGDEAYNLIAQGAQNGLNKNGDLLDVINEYSVHYKDLGYTSEQFFNSLSNGTDAGTFSVDKLGDAMKEFSIRVRDGSDTTAEAFEILGYDAEEMFKQIEDGSFFAEGMVGALIDELGGMPDSIAKTTAGVGLFGTMWEDLGAEGIRALGNLKGEISLTENSLNQINAVKYDSVGDALQGIGRNLQTGILMPISEKILPIVSELASEFSAWLNDPATQQAISDLTDNISQFVEKGLEVVKTGFNWLLDNKDAIIAGLVGIGAGFLAFNVATTIMTVVSAIKAFTSGLTLAQVAMKAFNLVMGANPILKIATIIITVVTAIATFIATNDEARAKFLEIWGNIVDGIKGFVDKIKVFFTETIPAFFQSLIDWVKNNWQSILLFLINPFAGLFKYFYENNTKFKEFVDNAITHIKELPGKVGEWITNTLNRVIQWATDMITKAKETGKNFLESVINFFQELPYKIGYIIGYVFTKVVAWATDMINKAKETGKNFLESLITFISQLPDKIWTFILNAYNKVVTWSTNMVTKAKETGKNFIDSVISFISQLPGKVWEWLVNVVTKVTTWVTDMTTKAKEAGKNFIDEVVTKIKELPGKVNEWLTSTIEKAKEWVSDMGQKGKDAIKELLDKVGEGAKEIPDKMLSIGKDIVDGVWSGIKNAKDQFFSNVKGFFSGLVDGAKKALDINSPSKVFAKEVGKWIPDGIAVGITDNAKSALKAVKNLSMDTVGGFNDGLTSSKPSLSKTGGVVNNFYQTINSPKQLSRLEIYRQSKNLLGYAGGGA